MLRSVLALTLVLGVGFSAWWTRPVPLPQPDVAASVRTPYRGARLAGYDRLFWAELHGDRDEIARVAETATGYLRYRALLRRVRDETLEPAERLLGLEELLAYGLISPLRRDDLRRAQLELGDLAAAAGETAKAAAAYGEALPLAEAVWGLSRLDLEPRERAQIFLTEREPDEALRALRGVQAPELRAPALAATGELEEALAVYGRILRRQLEDAEALEGRFSVLIALERFRQAEALLPELADPLEGAVRLAEAENDPEAALEAYLNLYRERGDEGSLWAATELLEEQGDAAAALPLYLDLARTEGDYSDDAAFRAYTLATRAGNADAARAADALVPADSFFGLLRGKTRPVPDGRLERVTPPVLELSRQLQEAGDTEAALGELLIALNQTRGEAEAVAVAEALQDLGEYGASSERARDFIEAGSRARRTYRAAYPRAFETAVRPAALEFGVPPALLWAVMRQESHFYPRAVSVSSAKGPMQFVPGTWEYIAELLHEPPADPFDVQASARYGAFYLARLLEGFGGNLAHSVAAYNGGPGYVGRLLEEPHLADEADFYRFITRDETREYVSRVLDNYAVYTDLY